MLVSLQSSATHTALHLDRTAMKKQKGGDTGG